MSKRWESIPQLFKRRTAFVFGGGPSLKLLEPYRDHFQTRMTLAVNGALTLLPEATVHFFGDSRWYWRERERVDAYKGVKVSANKTFHGRDPSLETVEGDIVLMPCFSFGFNCNYMMSALGWNRSSGAAAINLAYLMGACRIVLFGFDMRTVDDRTDYFHSPTVVNAGAKFPSGNWENMLFGMAKMVDSMRRQRIDIPIFNATPGSALKLFPIMDVAKAVRYG